MSLGLKRTFSRKVAGSYNVPLALLRCKDVVRYAGQILNRHPLADQAGCVSCTPLLIVGSGRSGTTLLRSILVAGGDIAIPPESYVIPKAVRRFISTQFLGWSDCAQLLLALFEAGAEFHLWETNLHPAHRCVVNLPVEERSLARLIDEVFKCYVRQQFPAATTWGDQSPLNTLHLPWIYRTFPGARYLHLLRDGRDAIASMVDMGRSIEVATSRWKRSMTQVLRLQPRLSDDQFLEVRYENLVSDPTDTLDRVCSFVNIDFKPQMLDFWKLPTTVEQNHYQHHRNLGRPLFTDSIGSWQKRLSPSQQAYIESRVTGLLEDLGYRGAQSSTAKEETP